MEIPINSELKLIGAHPRYAEEMFKNIDEHRSDLEQWLPWVPNIRSAEAERVFLRDAARFNAGGQSLTVLLKYRGQIAGSLAFVKIDKLHAHAEMGYMLFPPFRGKGLMTQACRSLIAHGFGFTNTSKKGSTLERVYVLIEPENKPSLALAKRLGFQREGLLRKHYRRGDTLRDVVCMGLLKEEFRSGQ